MSKSKDKKNREKIDKLFKQSWQGKSVTLNLDGTDIEVDITSQTRQHFSTMNNIETYRAYKARMKCVLSNGLISLISGATYEKTETERKSGQNKIHKYTKEWHYFAKNIQFNNKNYKVVINIRESSQIQGLFVLHAVLFKETSLQNQQTLSIKKSQRATLACSANSKSSSASSGSLSNNNQTVNINFEKFFSKTLNLYLIPYNDTVVSVKKIEDLPTTLDYANVGWNDTNYKKILPIEYWINEDYLAEKQDDWLKTHGDLNEITYADTIDENNSNKLKDLCDECKNDISEKIALAALIIGGFSDVDENVDEIKQLVTLDIDQDNFSKCFTGKVKNIIVEEIQPNVQDWINQLPSEQFWAKDLAKNAKEFFDSQGEGRIAMNVKEYIENSEDVKKMEGTRIEINDGMKHQLKTYFTANADAAEPKKIIEKNKGEEL